MIEINGRFFYKHLSFFILKKKEEENYKVFVENGQI
jgi:hypothetical protein